MEEYRQILFKNTGGWYKLIQATGIQECQLLLYMNKGCWYTVIEDAAI